MKRILASVDATPSKQLSKPLNVTRFKPSYAAFAVNYFTVSIYHSIKIEYVLPCEVSSRLPNAASTSSRSNKLCTGATARR